MNQTTPPAALEVLHHQHTEGGSGHSGTVSVARWNVRSHDSSRLEFNFVPQNLICTDAHTHVFKYCSTMDSRTPDSSIKSSREHPVAERFPAVSWQAYKHVFTR
jgi:hypothetical protein